jgi:hypothetical protein
VGAMADIQKDPAAAMKKYGSDRDIGAFIKYDNK